jgi:cytidylate kinase
MTTVVFPAAYMKLYLDASVEERARRRTLELLSKGFEIDAERIRLDIMERDARDSGRDIAPLKRADDARLIDSTGRDRWCFGRSPIIKKAIHRGKTRI